MSRKLAFWVSLILISVLGILFTLKYFSEAFPIVTLDLSMDRAGALKAARNLSDKYRWGPKDYSQAASFDLDSEVQNYIELEVGGSKAFKKLLAEGLYQPYMWRVRHFREGDSNEMLIRFTPDGKAYGFREKLPEDAKGASLSSGEARLLAEKEAREGWHTPLEQYALVETSQEERPGGRRDHTFVYERPDKKIGEGLYRLRLVAGGDRLTEITHFIKVPEAFSRRYEEMRSANETIASVAQYAVLILYLGGGCVIGLFFLLRQRWVLWKKPLLWAMFIAFLNLLGGLSALPLSWMSYNTALSAQAFLVQQILYELGGFAVWTLVLSLSFMAAETLTRKAFPHMIQHWKLWEPGTASSLAVLGRTLGGYLIVGFDFAFVVAVYFISTRRLGWWTPSDVLFQPNLLATYFPWLSGVAQSLQAGFWEECLFRAVPLAGAAIIGQRFGKKKLCIAVAFILQALIFGAGHANYPSQPAYARLVELIVPSFVFGGIYLAYGLLPSIISHFVFDVVWFSLPLFVSRAGGIWVDRAMVILLTLIPLWVVLRARLKQGLWGAVPEESYNGAWKPPEPKIDSTSASIPAVAALRPVVSSRWLTVGGLCGFVLWISCTHFQQDGPYIRIGMHSALEIAQRALTQKGIALSPEWKAYPSFRGDLDSQDRFIWQKGGRQIYQQLMGSYLPPPGWNVRFARFEGDVVKRAEEYRVDIGEKGNVIRLQHILPESAPGNSLADAQARILAHDTLRTVFRLDPAALKEISAVASKLPARQDWTFTFSDSKSFPLKEGQARIAVLIAGDQLADAYRYIFVPEDWERQETSRNNIADLILICCWSFLIFGLLGAGILAIVQWSQRRFPVSTFLFFFAILALARILSFLNHWPVILSTLSTAEPVSHQFLKIIAGSLISILLQSASIALVLGYVQTWITSKTLQPLDLWLKGISIALIFSGALALLDRLIAPSLSPQFAEYGQLGSYLPVFGSALSVIHVLVNGIAIVLLFFVFADRFTATGSKRGILGILFFLLLGLSLAGLEEIDSVRYWAVSGVIAGFLLWGIYRFVARFGLLCLAVSVATVIILGAIVQAAYRPFPYAVLADLIQILTVCGLTYWSIRKLSGQQIRPTAMSD